LNIDEVDVLLVEKNTIENAIAPSLDMIKTFNKLSKLLIFFDKTNLYRLILAIGLSILLTFSSLTICLPATALLRQHHETSIVLRYHARDSLKDSDGNTWQVVLFPDKSESNTNYFLRLVGFPEVNTFTHPQSLEILTDRGRIYTAKDAYPQQAPAPNVGQYNLTQIVNRLPSQGSLKLSVPLLERNLSLKIPHEVLTEWQLLTQEIEPS
jgi:hypothetical protein